MNRELEMVVAVLILVLMEDTLRVPSLRNLLWKKPLKVLILVLMEDTLRVRSQKQTLEQSIQS